MNRNDLIVAVAEKSGLKNSEAAKAVAALLEVISGSLVKGEPVVIVDFGKFDRVETKARVGRNPKTGEPVDIPAKGTVKFRPGKKLKDLVEVAVPF